MLQSEVNRYATALDEFMRALEGDDLPEFNARLEELRARLVRLHTFTQLPDLLAPIQRIEEAITRLDNFRLQLVPMRLEVEKAIEELRTRDTIPDAQPVGN